MTPDELLTARLAGRDVTSAPGHVSDDAFNTHPDGDMKVGKSLRMPLSMFTAVTRAATRRKMSWSELVRTWISEGLARDGDTDPVVQLHHSLDAAARALRELETHHPTAA